MKTERVIITQNDIFVLPCKGQSGRATEILHIAQCPRSGQTAVDSFNLHDKVDKLVATTFKNPTQIFRFSITGLPQEK